MYGVLFQTEAQLYLKNAFSFSTYGDLLSLHSFKPRKNIPALLSITDRKPQYLELHKTYAQ